VELTWVAILASLAMALATACVFIYAVKNDHFKNIEDTKCQVFWSDLEEDASPVPKDTHPMPRNRSDDGGSSSG
jgi:hypothetical protein